MKITRTLALSCLLLAPAARSHAAGVDALIYSTMPSSWEHRPELAMDGDPATYFKSFYDMGSGDDVQIVLSRPTPLRSLRVTTGSPDGQDTITNGFVDVSTDGATFTRAAAFDAKGVAQATLPGTMVSTLRIRLNQNQSVPSLLVREITLAGPDTVTHAQRGAGRAFSDISRAPDVAGWARRAEREMESFWAETAAILYSPGFITPNKVNVIYRTEANLPPGSAGGGVMTVDANWARRMPGDTGLTVHEVAHVVQSMSTYNPVWLIEGVADYVRWVKFEPQNHKPRINPETAKYSDSYRTTGTFLGWCELQYDKTLVTKLNDDIRFGRYKPALWKTYTGKDIDALWTEFIAAYRRDPLTLLARPLPLADRPRALPTVKAGTSTPVSVAKYFNASGFSPDGAAFTGGFDGGGATYSATLLGATQTANGVRFDLGPATGNNIITAQGQTIDLPAGKRASLWILGAGAGGNQMAQEFTINYTDGSSQKVQQNVSDWYSPRNFPGESRAVRMAYRLSEGGVRDPRPFYAYSYGFALDPSKTVRSLALPDNQLVRILGVTLAD